MDERELREKWHRKLEALNEDGVKFLDYLMGDIVNIEKYTTKDEKRLQELKEQEAKERAEEATRKREAEAQRKAFESTPVWERNSTMGLIWKQRTYDIMPFGSKARRQFNDIRDAHKYDFNFDLAVEAFSLGVIWGKRMERARKKGYRKHG